MEKIVIKQTAIISHSATVPDLSYSKMAIWGLKNNTFRRDRKWNKGRKGLYIVVCAFEELYTKVPVKHTDLRYFLKGKWSKAPKSFQTEVIYHLEFLIDHYPGECGLKHVQQYNGRFPQPSYHNTSLQ